MNERLQPDDEFRRHRQLAAPQLAFEPFPIEEVESTIPARFEKLARRYSNRLAVRCRQGSYTYAELNAFANQIAGEILNRPRGGEQQVIVLLENSSLAIAAILGVLKSGKAYVPLDPSDPPSRLAYMIQDAQASLVLTDAKSIEAVRGMSLPDVSCIDVGTLDSRVALSNLDIYIAPTQHANIIYTSGSTGAPKGVLQNHRNLLFDVRRVTHSFCIRPDDRLALVHSCNTAASLRRIFPALLNGASLHLLRYKAERLEDIAQWFVDEKITISNARWLLRDCAPFLTGEDQFPELRLVTFGGEPTYRRDIELCHRYLSPDCVVLINLCTTETGSDRQFFLDRQTAIPDSLLPVGYATEGTDVLLLDDNGHEVPVGEVGEIAVRSRYLALGYWRKPELTRQRFLADPAGGDARVYLTGDLGRLDADGCLYHLGRKDFQVKIRGHRIETLEVEQALLSLGEIKEAIVFAHAATFENGSVAATRSVAQNENRLAACLIPAQRPAPTVSEIRRRLAGTLPEQMIPSLYLMLDVFPRLPSGKVDRPALMAQFSHTRQTRRRPHIAPRFVAPESHTEETLTGVWSEVLEVESIGIHDPFLELGGNSLLAARMTSQISKIFSIQLPVRALFDYPTIAELALAIERALQDGDHRDVSSIHPIAHADQPPLSFYQERTWLHEKDSPRNLEVKQFDLRGELHVDALKQALNEIVSRHAILRTNYVQNHGAIYQAIAPPSPFEVPMLDLSGASELQVREAERNLAMEMHRPLDLARDSILRACLLRLGRSEHRLFMAIHHIAWDGQSQNIFFRELGTLYRAFCQGISSPLPAIAVQYADYAVWQRSWLNDDSAVYRRLVDYWKAKLTTKPARLKLPRRFIRPFRPSLHDCQVSFTISPELTAQLVTLSKRANATLFTTTLASLKAALKNSFGQKTILVGTYSGARTHPELAGLIGYFVNLLPLQTSLAGNPPFMELVARVRETTLDAYSHADLPFEELCTAFREARYRPPDVRLIFDLKESEYEQNIAEIEVRRVRDLHTPVMPWGMTARLLHQQGMLNGFIIFDSTLYHPRGVAQLVEQWMQLLKVAALEPHRRLSELKTSHRRRAA